MFKVKSVNNKYNCDYKVLLIDKDLDILKFFKIHLNCFFKKVYVSTDSKEALTLLNKNQFDLIFLDLSLSPKCKKKLTDFIQSNRFVSSFIFTGKNNFTKKQEKYIPNFGEFLKKPFTIEELHKNLKKAAVRREKIIEITKLLKNEDDLLTLLTGKHKLDSLVIEDSLNSAISLFNEIKKGHA